MDPSSRDAPCIHGEMPKIGIHIALSTLAWYTVMGASPSRPVAEKA
jgi:hypothetical protein